MKVIELEKKYDFWMKNGQANRGKEFMPCNIQDPAVLSVRFPVINKGAMTANPREYAMGNPSSARAKKNTNIKMIISAIIIVHLLLLKHHYCCFFPRFLLKIYIQTL